MLSTASRQNIPRVPVAEIERAISDLATANDALDVEVTSSEDAKKLLALYTKAERLASFGKAALGRKIDDPKSLSLATGTSVGQARETIRTGWALKDSAALSTALSSGDISLDQANEIAKAEESRPGAADELIEVARKESFQVLRDKARALKLEAEQHRDLFERQRKARSARSYSDELGMTHVHLTMQPHIGAPLVARAEAEAKRLYRAVKRETHEPEPFERYLCDAYVKMLTSSPVKGPAKRPELVVLVSYEVTKRGWDEVREGEVCKIPGLGPVAPEVARDIAGDAFLNGLFYDGTDLRHFQRWTRDIPVAVRTALELGPAPDFDGVKCSECGDHFYTELDHIEPVAADGPTSTTNNNYKCYPCHVKKTEADRRAGKLKPRAGPSRRKRARGEQHRRRPSRIA